MTSYTVANAVYRSSDVVDAKTLEQVATVHLQTDEDLYAKQMYCLGMYYNKALIAIETNYSTFPQKKLEELGYPNFYVRETVDRYDKSVTKQFGFNTNRKTKPVILADLVELVREHTDIFNDERTLREMLTMVKKENGKQEAEEGYHDDKVMSISITHKAVSQVIFDEEPIIINPQTHFNIEKHFTNAYDYGEEMTIV